MSTPNDTQGDFPPILNLGEPFIYLLPDVGHQLHNFQYVCSATTGMFIWELFCDLPYIKLLLLNRPSIPGVVYLISRLTTLLFNAISLQFLVAGGDCTALYIAVGTSWVFASACTAMLFFLRVSALYRDSRIVKGFFAILWLCVIGGALTVPFARHNQLVHIIPNASYCMNTGRPGYEGAGIIVPAVFDTLIFIAVSYRLFISYDVRRDTTWKERVGFFFAGQGLPRLSKALLQGGQQYYLISVVANVVALTLFFAPSVPQSYHVMITLALLNLTNSMACKVYRDIKFGLISDTVAVSRHGRSTSNTIPFRAAPRSQGNVVVNVEVSTTCADTSGMRPGSAVLEFPRTSSKSEVDLQLHSHIK